MSQGGWKCRLGLTAPCAAFGFYPEPKWEATRGGCCNPMRKLRLREGK